MERDDYAVENRMPFLIETVDLILDRLPDFRVMVRVSATEYVDDGYSEDEIIALAPGPRARRCGGD